MCQAHVVASHIITSAYKVMALTPNMAARWCQCIRYMNREPLYLLWIAALFCIMNSNPVSASWIAILMDSEFFLWKANSVNNDPYEEWSDPTWPHHKHTSGFEPHEPEIGEVGFVNRHTLYKCRMTFKYYSLSLTNCRQGCCSWLINIVEAPFTKLLNFDVCVVWWCSDGAINSQEYKSFEIYAVTIKISMTEYHHWINGQPHHIF